MEGHYCDSFKSSNTALAKKVVNTLEVITCVIKRYENQKASSKARETIHPDLQLDMSCYMESPNNTHYQLKAIIVHKGETLTTGHYSTFIFYNKVKVEIDDRKMLNLESTWTATFQYCVMVISTFMKTIRSSRIYRLSGSQYHL